MKQTKKQDEYYLEKTIKDGNFIINVYRPIISEEENNRYYIRNCGMFIIKVIVKKKTLKILKILMKFQKA